MNNHLKALVMSRRELQVTATMMMPKIQQKWTLSEVRTAHQSAGETILTLRADLVEIAERAASGNNA